MTLWGALRVIAGAIVTLVSSLLVAVLLPVLGLWTSAVVGDWLPTWLFALPLLACPVAGSAVTGFLRAADWRVDTLCGSLAAALGIAVLGGLVGVAYSVFIMGIAPVHGPETIDFWKIGPPFVALGSGAGFAVGAVLGALGGAGGSVLGRELRR